MSAQLFLAWFLILMILPMLTSSETLIDTHYPIIFTDQFKQSKPLSAPTSHFGSSVTLLKPFLNQSSTNGYPQAWIFIGAPKGISNDPTYPSDASETGVIWRCSLGAVRNAETCEIVQLDPVPDETRGQCSYRTCEDYPAHESKNQSWVGGHMASVMQDGVFGSSGRFVSCAHRWARGGNSFVNGLCYFFDVNDVSKLHTTDRNNFMADRINLKTFQHRLIPFFEKFNPKINQNQYFPVKKYSTRNNNLSEGVKWAVGQAGTSFHAFKVKDSNNVELLIGAPGVYIWAGAVIRYQDGSPLPSTGSVQRRNAYNSEQFRQYMISSRKNSDTQNWYDYFGYAVTSGYYNISMNQLLYVAGAPRSNSLQGEVVIFDFPEENDGAIQEKYVLKLMKTGNDDADGQTGSYFGSVLTTVKFNGDSYDDLFVGAPLLSKQASHASSLHLGAEGDEGCVFLYTSEKQFAGQTPPQKLIGEAISGGRFGSAISDIGDINGDGLNDVAIGAPYQNERSGVVYIYLGRRDDLNQLVINWNQKILASDFNVIDFGPRPAGFGISISNALDIDGNGTPDIAIGSYESDQVVVLRTRPAISIHTQVNYELYEGDQRKLVSVLPKTQQMFTLRSCVRFTAKLGKPSNSISLKTTIIVDERYQRFSLNKVARFPPSKKLSNTSLEYSETLGIDAEYSCTEIEVSRLRDYPEHISGIIPSIKIDVKVMQENQFKDTNSTLVRHHRIINSRPPFVPRVVHLDTPIVRLNNNQPAFEDFCSQCTYHTQKQFEFSLPISSCIDRDCKPDLKIQGGFLADENNVLGGFIDKFVLGSSKRLCLIVTIKNDGDVAIMPKLSIRWNKPGLKPGQKPLECQDETPSALSCKIGDALGTGRNKTLQIYFDMSNVFAHELQEYLLIDAVVSSTRADSEKDVAQQFALSLVSDPNLKVNVVASAVKEVYYLGSPFDHSYEIYLDGKSPVDSLSIRFQIPFYADINGETKQIARILRFLQPRQGGKVSCDVPKEALMPAVEGFDGGITPVIRPPTIGDLDGVNLDYGDTDNMPNGELELEMFGRRRRDTVQNSLGNRKEKLESPSKDTVLLTCDDENLRIECLEIKCTAENVQPRPSVLVFTFNMALINITAKELLDFSSRTSIAFRSHAMAEAIRLRDSDSDSGQTLIHTIQSSLPVAGWIYIVAAIVGCGVLALIVFILHRIGFFRREKREQLDELKQEVLRHSLRSRVGSVHQQQQPMEEDRRSGSDSKSISRDPSLSSLSQDEAEMPASATKDVAVTKL